MEEEKIYHFKNIWEGKKILVAEDETTCVFLIKEILKNTKIEIIVARNGQEAIQLCNNVKNLNLVLLDYKMPIYNGDYIAQKVRQSNDLLPIVIHTNSYQYEVRQKCLNAGCCDVIYKPLRKLELLEKIEKWIN